MVSVLQPNLRGGHKSSSNACIYKMEAVDRGLLCIHEQESNYVIRLLYLVKGGWWVWVLWL